jgi:hypothetical protein
MNRSDVERWVSGYERAWRTAGTDELGGLFSPDAIYLPSPLREPVEGLTAIAHFWEDERGAGGTQGVRRRSSLGERSPSHSGKLKAVHVVGQVRHLAHLFDVRQREPRRGEATSKKGLPIRQHHWHDTDEQLVQ